MVDDKVVKLASDFAASLTSLFGRFPEYHGDFSWPSLGTVDLLTYRLRDVEEYSSRDLEMINSVAAYIGGIAYEVWARFPDNIRLQLKLFEGQSQEVILTASGGERMGKGESFNVNLTKTITQVLQNPPNPFPVFADYLRSVPPDHNRLSIFGTGLLSGLCPFGEGPWSRLKPKEFAPSVVFAMRAMASSSASYYQKLFPHEELGQDPDLYLAELILPPAMCEEPYPACRASTGLIKFLKSKECTEEQMGILAMNLAGSPDELISSAGFILAAALLDGPPNARLRAIAESKKIYVPALRPALLLARELLGRPDDWVILAAEEKYDEAFKLIEAEKNLGFLPLLAIPAELIKTSEYFVIYEAIAWSNPEAVRSFIDRLATETKLHPEMELQGIYCDLIMHNLEAAEAALEKFERNSFKDKASFAFRFWELQASAALMGGELDKAVNKFEQAFKHKQTPSKDKVRIANDLALSLLYASKFEDALSVLNHALGLDSVSVPTKLARISVFEALGQEEKAKEDIENLALFAAVDRRVLEKYLECQHKNAEQLNS